VGTAEIGIAFQADKSPGRYGAACLNPYTQHPYEIAGGLAALDATSGGRAYLGLARGALGCRPARDGGPAAATLTGWKSWSMI
jgi:hypothetical protein